MYVNQLPTAPTPPATCSTSEKSPECPCPLLQWCSSQSKLVGYTKQLYSVNSILDTPIFDLIMASIEYEGEGDRGGDKVRDRAGRELVQYWMGRMEGFLGRECARRWRGGFRGRVVGQQAVRDLVACLLYCCVNSQHKQSYISRIVSLPEQTQTCLMVTLQQTNQQTLQLSCTQKMLQSLQQLQTECQNLKQNISVYSQKQISSCKQIKELEEELYVSNCQLKKYRAERDKICQFGVGEFDEFYCLFERVKQENGVLGGYVEQLEDHNAELRAIVKELKNELEQQALLLQGLNHKTTPKHPKQPQQQPVRSFGSQLTPNSLPQNKQNKSPRHFPICFSSPIMQKQNWRQEKQAMTEEMSQLRKYNSDLISKLEGTYKTLSGLMHETGRVKDDNERLRKENRFFRKQVGKLKGLQNKMEEELRAGIL